MFLSKGLFCYPEFAFASFWHSPFFRWREPPSTTSPTFHVCGPTSLTLNFSMYLINSKQIKPYQSCFIVHLRCLESVLQYFCLEEYLKYYYCHIGERESIGSVFLTVTLVPLGVFSARPWWLSCRRPLCRSIASSPSEQTGEVFQKVTWALGVFRIPTMSCIFFFSAGPAASALPFHRRPLEGGRSSFVVGAERDAAFLLFDTFQYP